MNSTHLDAMHEALTADDVVELNAEFERRHGYQPVKLEHRLATALLDRYYAAEHELYCVHHEAHSAALKALIDAGRA